MFTDENPEIILKDKYIYASNNKPVHSKLVKKIRQIGIPPAYKKLWVTSNPKSDIQAVAEDLSGKKQYFYNRDWKIKQTHGKNVRMYRFMKKLSVFWKSVETDAFSPDFDKKKVMSNMFKIMNITNIRIGNKKYKGVGLTTLKKKNISFHQGNKVILSFKGKSGVDHVITVDHKDLNHFFGKINRFPGEWLFQYRQSGKFYRVTSNDMNDYLQSKIGKEFTCKDFRTHASNCIFLDNLQKLEINSVFKNTVSKNISIAIDKTAAELGHTRSTSKKSYINNKLVEEYTKDPIKIKNGNRDKILMKYYKSHSTGI